jgi:predicted nucleic acid-binding protein
LVYPMREIAMIGINTNRRWYFDQSGVFHLTRKKLIITDENEQQLVEEYQNILCNSPSIDIIDLTIEIAIKAATLRAKYGIKTPDSIQVATAINASSEYFLTNDIRLKAISEIEILILDEIVKE